MPKQSIADPNDLVYSRQEAADLLGLHPQTISRWIQRGVLRANRNGRDYRIRRSDLIRAEQASGDARVAEILRSTSN